MRKNLLLATLVLPICLLAQKKAIVVPAQIDNSLAVPYHNETFIDPKVSDSVKVQNPKQNTTRTLVGAKRDFLNLNFIILGNTTYDLQTNASMGRRIILLPNGNISAVWTTSTENSTSFSERGTGYNNFNGTAWFNNPSPTPRLENSRTGWPSIGLNGNTEWVMGHNSVTGGFVKSNNTAIGSQTWTSGPLVLGQTNRRPIWSRTVNSGDTFHTICNYADSSVAGEKRAPTIKGIFAPFTYSRSTNGGVTWSTQHILLPGYDSSRYVSGGGDQYAIDVKGDILTIVSGYLYKDVAMWKSIDGGLTFTKTIVDTFDYAPYRDTVVFKNKEQPLVCDGSLSVAIDNNGKAHVSWGVSRLIKNNRSRDSSFFVPATALLAYWNENTKKTEFIAGESQFPADKNADLNFGNMSDTTWSFYPGTWQDKPTSVRLVDKTTQPVGAARTGGTSLLHMPSIGIGANNTVFISFSLPVAGDVDADYCNFRDVMMVASTNGGTTWLNPINVTKRQQKEDDFACIAKVVNNFVHLIFQSDDLTGTNLQNNVSGSKPVSSNDILYAAIPVSRILDGSIGITNNTSIDAVKDSKEIFIVSQNQPNPFSNNTNVLVWLDGASDITLEVTNISGQIVSNQSYKELGVGNHNLNIEANNLTAGIYFYTVKTATHRVTQKMIVQ